MKTIFVNSLKGKIFKAVELGLPIFLLLVTLLACEKEALPTLQDSQLPADIIQRSNTTTFTPVFVKDAEEEGLDDAENRPPRQTDFLFDIAQDTINLVGQSTFEFGDETLENPRRNLVGHQFGIDLFERESPTRKVASIHFFIKEIKGVSRDLSEVYTDIRFDFGHGSIYGLASFDFSAAQPYDLQHFQFVLKEVQFEKGTRFLEEFHDNISCQALSGTVTALFLNSQHISCNIDLSFKEDV